MNSWNMFWCKDCHTHHEPNDHIKGDKGKR